MSALERRAAIDIGTVTTRLLIAEVGDGAIRELERRAVITHLGEGWTETGVLSDAGMERVERTVAEFMADVRELGVQRVVAVATSASRDAVNGPAFLDRLEAVGIRPEIISGGREAQLTFAGATYGGCCDDTLVVDIGGGSTELILGSPASAGSGGWARIEMARSIDVGSRRVTELFLRDDPPTARQLDEAAGWVADQLRPYFSSLGKRAREMVAVAGTATSLAAIDLALDPYDPERVHGYRLSGHALLDILQRLAETPLAERRRVVGLDPERAGVIVGGAVILQAVLAYSGLSSTLVSEHDILYGMVLDAGSDSTSGP